MPSTKISQPTVSYLNVFPESGHEEKITGENGNNGQCLATVDDKMYTGKYLEMVKYNFKDAQGQLRSAEGVHMVPKKSTTIDQNGKRSPAKVLKNILGNLTTIAVINKQIMCDCVVLVKQYRAPLKTYTIEFPATVIHSEDVPEDLAAKEIEDDTGYSSYAVKYISPLTSLEPDISDGKQQFVSLNIDGDDPIQKTKCRNNNQSVSGDEGAHGDIVEVLKVPITGLLRRLEQYDGQGCVIDSRVMTFAIGLERGANLHRTLTVPESEETE
jgi:hypothetical protein